MPLAHNELCTRSDDRSRDSPWFSGCSVRREKVPGHRLVRTIAAMLFTNTIPTAAKMNDRVGAAIRGGHLKTVFDCARVRLCEHSMKRQ